MLKRFFIYTVGIALTVIIIFSSSLACEEISLSEEGIKTLAILLLYLVLLISESVPIVLSSLLCLSLLPLLKVTSGLGDALSGFSNPATFFTLSSLGIVIALTSVPFPKRILKILLQHYGKNINRVLLSVMICTCLVSSIMSNIPACAIFMTISISFLDLYENKNLKNKTAKAFMIAIPIASMIGGMITPIGSTVNIIAIQQLADYNVSKLTFLSWVVVSLPIAILLLFVAWFLICVCFKPADIAEEDILRYVNKLDVPSNIDKREAKVLIIVGIMIILWVLSGWITDINTIGVSILGCCVLMMPRFQIIDANDFVKNNNWNAFFLVGTTVSLSAAMRNNGVSDCIIIILEKILPHNIMTRDLIVFVAVCVFVLLLLIPVATNIIPIVLPIFISIAINANISPVIIMLTVAYCAGNCYLLPLDIVPQITYSKGYYRMYDMFKVTIWLQLLLLIICACWLPIAETFLHI